MRCIMLLLLGLMLVSSYLLLLSRLLPPHTVTTLPLGPYALGRLTTDALRSYLTQTRSELSQRLVDRLYPTEQEIGADGNPTGKTGARATKPSKWWMSFQKRR
jgi:hypothetical protein